MTARIDYAAMAPDVYKALIGTRTALKRSGFDGNLMNLVFQRVSQLNGCAYCVDMHGREMRATGRRDDARPWLHLRVGEDGLIEPDGLEDA